MKNIEKCSFKFLQYLHCVTIAHFSLFIELYKEHNTSCNNIVYIKYTYVYLFIYYNIYQYGVSYVVLNVPFF